MLTFVKKTIKSISSKSKTCIDSNSLKGWKNLQRQIKKRVSIQPSRIVYEEGYALTPLQVIFYRDILAGGLIAGLVFYLLIVVAEELNKLTGRRIDVLLAITLLVSVTICIYLKYRK